LVVGRWPGSGLWGLASGGAERNTTLDAGRCERFLRAADASPSGAVGDVIGAPLATDEGGGGTGAGAAGFAADGVMRPEETDALDCGE
jgi:hypothetical protein